MIAKIQKHSRLLQDFSYMYFVVVLQKLLSIVVTYFLVRVLTENQFAEYTLIISYLSLFAAFSLPEIGNAVMQSTARGAPGLYFKAQRIMLGGTVLAGLIIAAVAWGHKMSGEYGTTLYMGLLCAALLFPFYRGLTIWKNYRSGLNKFKELSILSSTAHIATNLAILFLLIGYDVSDYLLLIIAYMLIPAGINIAMSLVDFASTQIRTDKTEPEDGMIEYGLKTSAYSALHTLAFRLDHFVLFYLISPEALALFAVANRIPEMLREVTQTLAAVLAPRFAKHSFMTREISKAITLYSLAIGSLIILVTFTIYPFFMTCLFGDLYSDSIFYSQIIMCSLVIGNVATLNFRYIRSQKDTRNYRNVILAISAIRILAIVILVPLFDIWGAVASIFVYRVSMTLMTHGIISKEYAPPPTTA